MNFYDERTHFTPRDVILFKEAFKMTTAELSEAIGVSPATLKRNMTGKQLSELFHRKFKRFILNFQRYIGSCLYSYMNELRVLRKVSQDGMDAVDVQHNEVNKIGGEL